MVQQRIRPKPKNYFTDWKQREALAESMIPMIGRLYRKNVHVLLYGQPLINISVLDIMQSHRFVRETEENELSEFETHPVLSALIELQTLGSGQVDIGKLAVQFGNEGQGLSVAEFVASRLTGLIDGNGSKPLEQPRDVVLYGFGRIGRLIARLLVEMTAGGDNLRLRAVTVRGNEPGGLAKRANLLQRDSVHGPFHGTVRVDEESHSLIANGNEIRLLNTDSPDLLDYTELGIDNAIVVDNTGIWRTAEQLEVHLRTKGVDKVLVTAPGKGNLLNIVHGANESLIRPEDKIVTATSCTTNAIVLPLKVIDEKYGIVRGHVETVHAYTNDQNLIDNYHRAKRRGRSAALNIVLTETGAANAVAGVLPNLAGKLTGNAIRVPVPDVSLAILHLELQSAVDRDELNHYLRRVALHSALQRQVGYSSSPEVVSSDIIGSRHACVIDSEATIVNGNNCILYVWYDNEFGYACQVVRVLEEMTGLRYKNYPEEAA